MCVCVLFVRCMTETFSGVRTVRIYVECLLLLLRDVKLVDDLREKGEKMHKLVYVGCGRRVLVCVCVCVYSKEKRNEKKKTKTQPHLLI